VTKKVVTYVVTQESSLQIAEQLEKDLNIEIWCLDDIKKVFQTLSSGTFYTDVVLVSIKHIEDKMGKVDIIDLVNTINTLMRISDAKLRPDQSKITHPRVCVFVNEETDLNVVKQLMITPGVFLGSIISDTWTFDDVKNNLARNFKGDFSPPKNIIERVKKKKSSVIIKKNEIHLTPREQQILSLIQDRGATNKVIAKLLNISESTVKLHVGKVFKKYGCKNRTQLVLFSKKKPLTEVQARLIA